MKIKFRIKCKCGCSYELDRPTDNNLEHHRCPNCHGLIDGDNYTGMNKILAGAKLIDDQVVQLLLEVPH